MEKRIVDGNMMGGTLALGGSPEYSAVEASDALLEWLDEEDRALVLRTIDRHFHESRDAAGEALSRTVASEAKRGLEELEGFDVATVVDMIHDAMWTLLS